MINLIGLMVFVLAWIANIGNPLGIVLGAVAFIYGCLKIVEQVGKMKK